jgi:hypothetical protein
MPARSDAVRGDPKEEWAMSTSASISGWTRVVALAAALGALGGCAIHSQSPVKEVAYDFSDRDFYDRAYAPSPHYGVSPGLDGAATTRGVASALAPTTPHRGDAGGAAEYIAVPVGSDGSYQLQPQPQP